jgi:hypothetical protein
MALLLMATPAVAQPQRPERPYRGLFGSGVGDAEQLLTASASIFGGYDDNVYADMLGDSGAGTQGGASAGSVAGASGSLAYSFKTEPMTVGLSLGSSTRYYPGTSDDTVTATQGGLTLTAAPRLGTSLSLGLLAAYQPYQLTPLFHVDFEPQPGDSLIPDLDLVTTVESYLRYAGRVGFTHRVSRQATFSADYGYQHADRGAAADEFRYQNLGGALTYNLGKGLDARAGYTYGEGDYGAGQTREHHAIDAGVNYNRALSISRQTTLAFGTGTSALRTQGSLRFTITGNAKLQHEIGRSWNTWVGYARRVLMNETFPEPVVADSVSAGLRGLISRRMQFTSSIRAALGKQGLENDAPGFNTAQGVATLSYALTRFMNAGVTYFYYRQRFDDGAVLSVGVPATAERHSVRATISLWAPVFERTRRD